jgi:AraC-like DNA-binding protein
MNEALRTVTILGDRTEHHSVRSDECDPQGWLECSPVCSALRDYQILYLGVIIAERPYQFVRTKSTVTQFLACPSGAGTVLIDGQLTGLGEGEAALFPQHSAIAYHAVEPKPWRLVLVSYVNQSATSPVTTVSSPVLAPYPAAPLYRAVQSLYAECMTSNDPGVILHLIAAIHRCVVRFAQPWTREDRLHQVWEKVATDLRANWSIEDLARMAHCSGEHLRRLCQSHLGRSPMQHLTFLRLQQAANLLVNTDLKIEHIAQEVGYDNPFSFSVTFKRWMRCTPTEYRQIPPS